MPELEIRLFASLRELAGAETIRVSLDRDATAADLLAKAGLLYPDLASALRSVVVAVDRRIVAPADPVPPLSEVAFLPPVSGG